MIINIVEGNITFSAVSKGRSRESWKIHYTKHGLPRLTVEHVNKYTVQKFCTAFISGIDLIPLIEMESK